MTAAPQMTSTATRTVVVAVKASGLTRQHAALSSMAPLVMAVRPMRSASRPARTEPAMQATPIARNATSPVWVTLVYTVGAFSLWGGGWLAGMGVADFSGGYVIHLAAGTSGFVAAAMVGPRLQNDREHFPPNSLLVTLIGAGITVHTCLAAHDILGSEGISARVIDCYSVKPIDEDTLRRALDATDLLVVVEDHRIEGGLGDAVLEALAGTGPLHGRVAKLAVTDMPGSATPEELRAWAGIDADGIADTVRRVLRS